MFPSSAVPNQTYWGLYEHVLQTNIEASPKVLAHAADTACKGVEADFPIPNQPQERQNHAERSHS